MEISAQIRPSHTVSDNPESRLSQIVYHKLYQQREIYRNIEVYLIECNQIVIFLSLN
jgi:hypothetical protein